MTPWPTLGGRSAWPLDASGPQIVVQLPSGAETYMHHRVLLAFEGQGCRIATTPDDENELRSSVAMKRGSFLSARTGSCLLVDQQAIELSRPELRGVVRRAIARATASYGAGSPSSGASGLSLEVFPDGLGSSFDSVSPGGLVDPARVAGRALLLGEYGGLYAAVWIGADEVAAWRSAMQESHPGVVLVLLVDVVPEGGAACASEFTVWIAAGRRGLDQVYKPLRIYVEEPDPAPEPPPACGWSKRSLGAWLMTRLAGAR